MTGYFIPKRIFGYSERTSRTISIETGMQNSALAIVLAKSMGADPVSYLPGALSATAHSCLGSGLATFWRMIDYKKNLSKECHINEYT
jgi:BASS family bile acid:Na+ symporter